MSYTPSTKTRSARRSHRDRTVECSEIRDSLLRGVAPGGASFEAHVRSCPACAELVAGDTDLGQELSAAARGGPELDLDQLFSSLNARVQEERGLRAWLCSRSTPARAILAVSIVLALALYQLVSARRPDFAVYPVPRMALVLGVYVCGILLSVAALLRPLGTARREPIALAIVFLCLPVVLALLPEAATSFEPHFHRSFTQAAARCFFYGGGFVASIVIALWLLDRSDGLARASLLLLAACAGSAANLLLQIHCPNPEPFHLIVGHASIGFAWLLVLAAWRARSRA